MANRYVAMAVGAVLAAGSVGTGVYVANTQSDARIAMGAAHDVTTRHGEIAVRVDAGGADVTALAAVAPGTAGQVLTVGDAGVAVWRAPAGALPSGTGFVTVSSGTGGVLTASSTSAADLRTALGAAPADWTTVTADALSLRDGTRGTVTLTGGRLRFSLDGAGLAYYDGTTRSSPRAYWVPPTTARQVLVVARVYTRVSGSSNASSSVAVLLRPGTDDTADPALAAPTPAWSMNSAGYPPALVGISLRDTTVIATGDYYSAGWDGSATGTGSGTWPTTPATSTGWIGARWTWPQRADYAAVEAPADSPPLPTTFVWPASRVVGDAHSAVRDVGGAPMVVITYKMWAAAAAGVIDVDAVVYWR